MKKFLIFLLLSTIICEKSNLIQKITDIIKCLLKSGIIENNIGKIVEVIHSKDIEKIINLCKSIFNEFKNETNKCTNIGLRKLSNEGNYDDDIRLGYPKYVFVLYSQIGERAFQWYDEGGIDNLKKQCHYWYGQRTWYCLYLQKV